MNTMIKYSDKSWEESQNSSKDHLISGVEEIFEKVEILSVLKIFTVKRKNTMYLKMHIDNLMKIVHYGATSEGLSQIVSSYIINCKSGTIWWPPLNNGSMDQPPPTCGQT